MIQGRKLRILCFAFLWLLGVGVTDAVSLQLGSESRPAKERIARTRQEGPDRRAERQTDEILARLKLKPGDVVVDIGAGTGAFSGPLAQAVAPTGKLLAVEIDQELLDYIEERAKEEKIDNIQAVLGEFDDPKLPTRQVDLAFIHQV
ncbi:MAG: methyltransferase domain-containing protein, partial [Acidobacteria bacterium]|nr:methyltransferase domain-containing protein [Acidobacteriota bacterium]